MAIGKTHIKRRPSGETDMAWMLTYGDMVTLLLVFFILLAAISVVDASKYEEVKAGLVDSVSKKNVKKPFHELKAELDKMIEEQNLQNEVMADLSSRGITMEFASGTLFRSGEGELRPEAQPIIEKVTEAISKVSGSTHKMSVEGHTDDVPMKSAKYPSNWELSTSRATNVLRALLDEGIDPKRLKASGFADIMPKVPNRDENGIAIVENQAKNRRVVITIHR